MYFPKEKLGIAITANGDTGKKQEILREALGYYFNDTILVASEEELKKYPGHYVSVTDKTSSFTFTHENKALILEVGKEMREVLAFKGSHKFLFEQVYAPPFTFVFSPDKNELLVKQGDYKGIYKKE